MLIALSVVLLYFIELNIFNLVIMSLIMQLKPISLLITTFLFLILLSLGFWQIGRLNEKNALIRQIHSELSKPTPPLPQNFTATVNDAYSKYKMHGRFLPGKDMLLYSSNPHHPERHGYFIMTPFVLDEGRVILINRGWAPQSLARNLPSSLDQGLERASSSIDAMVMLPKLPSIFIPKNDAQRNVWIYVDLKAMEDFAAVPIEQGFYMVLINGDDLPKELTIKRPEDFLQIRNDHLWYAVTWFSLAFAVAIIYYFRV